MTIRIYPAPPAIHGDAPRLGFDDAARYRAAALRARRRYPGCVGELVHRELTACTEFGHLVASDALVARLAGEILDVDAGPSRCAPAAGARSWTVPSRRGAARDAGSGTEEGTAGRAAPSTA